jgi:hypothetical protein
LPVAAAPGAEPVLAPNADGILDLAAVPARGETVEGITNPFRVRWQPPRPARETSVAIGAVLIGDGRPDATSAVINGSVYSPGDRFEGLSIAAIGSDAIELRAEGIRVRLPVREAPLILRLAR